MWGSNGKRAPALPGRSNARYGLLAKVVHRVNGDIVFERVMPVEVFWRWLDTLQARSSAWAAGHHRVVIDLDIPARAYHESRGAG